MSKLIRQTHRWLSIVFTATVIANFVVLGLNKQIALVTYSPLLPLALLMFTGLYMFVLPYAARRGARRTTPRIRQWRMNVAPKPKLGDWREETLDRIRAVILEADPEMIEERKWRKPSNGMTGVPVWSHNGIVCTGETYKNYVKMTFAKGAFVKDPSGLFNSGLGGNLRRAIDIHEGDKINEKALKALIKAAVKLNASDRE